SASSRSTSRSTRSLLRFYAARSVGRSCDGRRELAGVRSGDPVSLAPRPPHVLRFSRRDAADREPRSTHAALGRSAAPGGRAGAARTGAFARVSEVDPVRLRSAYGQSTCEALGELFGVARRQRPAAVAPHRVRSGTPAPQR